MLLLVVLFGLLLQLCDFLLQLGLCVGLPALPAIQFVGHLALFSDSNWQERGLAALALLFEHFVVLADVLLPFTELLLRSVDGRREDQGLEASDLVTVANCVGVKGHVNSVADGSL